MSSLIAGFVLFLTVSTATLLGIAAAYALITAILYAFAQRSAVPQRQPVLVTSETHAGGD